MNRLMLVLLLAVGLTSGASASILPAHKAAGPLGMGKTLFKKAMARQGQDQYLLGKATSYSLVADSLKDKRITAALLTIPLGFLGVHRIYLGTKPHIPIIYIATVGGCFGILPFIDLKSIVVLSLICKYSNQSIDSTLAFKKICDEKLPVFKPCF